MANIEQLTDFDTLKQAARLLEVENERLHGRLATLTEKLAKLEGKEPIKQLQLELTKLKEQVAAQRKKLFGRSSERRRRKTRDKKKRKKRTKFGYRDQPALPVEVVEHALEPDEQCKSCGGLHELTDKIVEAGEEVTVVEREYKLVRHQLRVYGCKCPGELVAAPAPVKLTPGARYSLDFAISVAIDKYLHHLPLARQVRAMRINGLIIDTQTLWDQLNALAELLTPSYKLIRDHILGADVIGADETWWRLMTKNSSKRWWVWAITTHDAVYYEVHEHRNTEAARKCLGDYKGTVMCDAYISYKSLASANPDLQLAYCWAHVRRKFIEAHTAYPDECDVVLDLIDELFLIERTVPAPERLEGQAKLDAIALRAELRDSKSRPIIDQLARWAQGQVALPQSKLAKAIGYMSNQWKPLLRFLDDPLLPIHNVHARERRKGEPASGGCWESWEDEIEDSKH